MQRNGILAQRVDAFRDEFGGMTEKHCEFCMGENTGKPEEYHAEVRLETRRCPHCKTRFCDEHWKESNECSCGGKHLERMWDYEPEMFNLGDCKDCL